MKIIVVGHGYVGKAMVELLTKRYDVDVYDPATAILTEEYEKYKDRTTFISRKEQIENKYDIAIVCVPTPMMENGECDVSYVIDAIHNTNADLFILKSTVEPGTTHKLSELNMDHIVFSPEYVGESQYYNSYFPDKMIETPFMIFGGFKEQTQKAVDFFLPILGPDKQYLQMTSIEAEIVKYMENSFFATKITYCQEMFDLCDKVGADWHTVREGWLADPRINPMHTAVFRNDRGFGGKCLVPGTKIRTMNEIRNIENIEVGDKLFDGLTKTTVTGKSKRNVNNIIKLKSRGRAIEGTEDHIHFFFSNKKLSRKLLRNFSINDWVFIPEQIAPKNKKIVIGEKPNGYIKWWKKQFVMDNDWARLIGLYLAEGCSSSDYSMIWSFGERDKKFADEVEAILKDKGLKSNKKLQISNGTFGISRCWIVRCRSAGLQELFNKCGFGKNAHDKDCYLLPKNLSKILIGGWLDGDGSYYDGTIAGHSESKELIKKIDTMLLTIGINAQIGKEGKKIKISMKKDVEKICSWTKRLKFDKSRYKRKASNNSPTMKKVNDGWITKINSIENSEGSLVYSVETTTHKYIANNILTHNCLPKDTNAIAHYMKKQGVDPIILDAVLKKNKQIRGDRP